MKTALHLAYFGKRYHGLQIQPNCETVASKLMSSFLKSKILKSNEHTKLKFASRTDKGVSALQQVLCIENKKKIFLGQINHYLPDDIRILAKAEVSNNFDPRMALSKTYRYIIFQKNLNIKKMRQASKEFIGTKSYHNFTKDKNKNFIREISKIKIQKNSDIVTIDVSAPNFLWQQVRKICYILKEIGESKKPKEDFKKYFNPKIDSLVPSLDSKNLILLKIKYNDLKFEYDKKELNKFMNYLREEFIKKRIQTEIIRQFSEFRWNI